MTKIFKIFLGGPWGVPSPHPPLHRCVHLLVVFGCIQWLTIKSRTLLNHDILNRQRFVSWCQFNFIFKHYPFHSYTSRPFTSQSLMHSVEKLLMASECNQKKCIIWMGQGNIDAHRGGEGKEGGTSCTPSKDLEKFCHKNEMKQEKGDPYPPRFSHNPKYTLERMKMTLRLWKGRSTFGLVFIETKNGFTLEMWRISYVTSCNVFIETKNDFSLGMWCQSKGEFQKRVSGNGRETGQSRRLVQQCRNHQRKPIRRWTGKKKLRLKLWLKGKKVKFQKL